MEFDLVSCTRPLMVLITSDGTDYSLIYDIVTSCTISASNQKSDSPIPYGTSITDHVARGSEQITIEGVVGCYRCDSGGRANNNDILPLLKKIKEKMIYCSDDYFRLVSNDWIMEQMILTSFEVSETQNEPQVKQVSTVWDSANLTGSIQDPQFNRGGVVYL